MKIINSKTQYCKIIAGILHEKITIKITKWKTYS